MARRKLNIAQVYHSFEGEEVKYGGEGENKDKLLRLRDVLIIYFRNAHRMGMTDAEQSEIYALGFAIGPNLTSEEERTSKKIIELTTNEYNTVKKLSDNGKVKEPNGNENYIYNIELKDQTKEFIDKAEIVEEKK